MLNLSEFPTHIKWFPISQFPLKSPQPHFKFPSIGLTGFDFCPFHWKLRTGFRSYASKNQGKSGNALLEMENFDGADDFVAAEDEEDDDDDDEVFVPLKDMKEWIENKPRGFGEGKVYDTSIEDKLMEEIEQSRTAQLANVNKLKNNPINPVSDKKEEVAKDVQDGFRVRLVNLPKKKNIHKDLQLAFKGFPGIVNITPVVSGNKKTREPICKGIAFVDFKSEDGAQRFVQNFSGQSIYFGKVQKQIKCEIMSSSSTKPKNVLSVDESHETSYDPELSEPDSDGDLEADFEINAHSPDSWEEIDSEENDSAMESAHQVDDYDKNVVTILERNSGDEHVNATKGSATKKKIEVNEKKKKAKIKKEKTSKFKIPGSAQRLKVREKALLSGVLSKYGLNTAEGEKEQS